MRSPLRGRGIAVIVVLLVVGAGAVVGATAMSEDEPPSGETILNDTVERYANAESVVGTAETTVSNATANATATVDFAAAGNASRVIVATDNRTYRAGSNGNVSWYAGPNGSIVQDHETIRRVADRHNVTVPSDRLKRIAGNASVDLLREDSDDGTPAYVLNVTHDNGSYDWHATVWVAQNDSRLLRVVATDGPNRTVVDYRETRFNVSVHGSTFDPPADRVAVTEVDQYDTFDQVQTNTSLDLPALNATFRDATVVRQSDGVGVAQRYVAAGDNTTVVSTTFDYDFGAENATEVTVNGHPANVTTVRDRAIVYWHNDSVTTALTAEASEDRAVELAGRLSE